MNSFRTLIAAFILGSAVLICAYRTTVEYDYEYAGPIMESVRSNIKIENKEQSSDKITCTTEVDYIKLAKDYFLRASKTKAEQDPFNINRDFDMQAYKSFLLSIDPVRYLRRSSFYKAEGHNHELNMRNAIIRFQSSINEAITGEITQLDRQIIANAAADIIPLSKDIVKNPPTSSKWIVINKTTRILSLYEGSKVIKKYPIAQGRKSGYTPEGKFAIVVKVKNPSWGGGGYAAPIKGGLPSNPLGRRWMGLSPEGGNLYGIHGNSSPYSIGTNASHGCIRMINSDVEELYDIVPNGTIVWIGTYSELKDWGVIQARYKVGNV